MDSFSYILRSHSEFVQPPNFTEEESFRIIIKFIEKCKREKAMEAALLSGEDHSGISTLPDRPPIIVRAHIPDEVTISRVSIPDGPSIAQPDIIEIAGPSGVSPARASVPSSDRGKRNSTGSKTHNGGTKQNGNLPKESVQVLMEWLHKNKDKPYPSVEDKNKLAKDANLTHTQVINWLINARRRYLPAMLISEGIDPEKVTIRRKRKMKSATSSQGSVNVKQEPVAPNA